MNGFSISICQNKKNYGTNILVYLEAMKKKIYRKKINLSGSYMSSQNLTIFGKSSFFEREKIFKEMFLIAPK